ncbi:nitrite reductase small subunit NirD [Pseudomonas sp. HR96]|uniref:nitrite reductase small subunit NirD n=1 Tax=Pseudomonas sp. HR96 TaxID=1027966 RepID=UPI002A756D6F|nr:nitrite reductase small subunit NirD [Pseudomonas sp. HR96]WPP01650.1 nitrite reductase small subunit NirD [Pseudomonas sp. HR96]
MSPSSPLATPLEQTWQVVCNRADLVANSGVVAWLQGRQIALFYVPQGSDGEQVFALDNCDPQSGANVIGRGLLGSLNGRRVVASPLYKQHFCLQDGTCLESAEQRLQVWPARIRGDSVELAGLG